MEMSSVIEPILKIMKPNQSKVLAVAVVLAGLTLGYSLLRSKPSAKTVALCVDVQDEIF